MMLQIGATAREGSPAFAMPRWGMAGHPAQAYAPLAFPAPAPAPAQARALLSFDHSERFHLKVVHRKQSEQTTKMGYQLMMIR